MKPEELIDAAAKRLTIFGRINLALALLLPAGLLLSGMYALAAGFLPESLRLSVAGAVILCFLWVLEKTWKAVRSVPLSEAAALLDSCLQAKERFLSIATCSWDGKEGSRRIIEDQSSALAAQFSMNREVPFSLERPAKMGLAVGLPVLAGALVLLFTGASGSYAPTALELARGRENAAALRDIINDSPLVPEALKNDLLQAAVLLEEQGIHSAEALAEVNDAIQMAEELLAERTPGPPLDQSEPEPQKQRQEEKAKERPQQQGEENKDEQPSGAKQQAMQPEQQPEENQQQQQGEKQPSQQNPDKSSTGGSQQGQQQKPSEGKRSDGERKQGAGQNPDGEGQQNSEGQKAAGEQTQDGREGLQGEQKKEDGSEQGQGEQSKGSKGGKQPEETEQKDVTGLGEGKGQGQSGSRKEMGGETQSGSDDGGAKEGEAKNESRNGKQDSQSGKQEGKEGREQKQPGSQSSSKQPGKDGANASGRSDSGKSGENDLSSVKDKLEDVKKEMEGKDPGDKKQSGEGRDDAKDGQTPEQQRKQQGRQGQQQDKNEETNKPGSTGQQPQTEKQQDIQGAGKQKEQQQSAGGKGSEKKTGKPSEGSSQGDKAEDPQQQSDSGEEKAGKSGQDKAGTSPEHGEQGKGDADGKEGRTPSAESKSRNPDKAPSLSQSAQRYGPFDGGMEQAKQKKLQDVAVPTEDEKVLVRSVGRPDNKLYKNEAGAHAKTKVESSEFIKAEDGPERGSQPIPVEYGDILR